MVFIFSIEILANIEVMSSISNINRVIEDHLWSIIKIINFHFITCIDITIWINGIYIFNRNFGEHRSYVIDIKH